MVVFALIADGIGKCMESVKSRFTESWNLAHDVLEKATKGLPPQAKPEDGNAFAGLKAGAAALQRSPHMPTLYRLLFFGGAIAASIYGVMLALAIFVEPGQKDMVIEIPPGQLPVTTAGQ